METIEEMIKQLPIELQREVRDFVRRLLDAKPEIKKTNGKKLRLTTWAGALNEYRDDYTSLDLQRKALEWWGN